MKKPEILAPAGSFDSLVAAVHCGADAVYLGSKSLNARRNAGNFDGEELRRAVAFCHERGTKVYQTLNIVLFEPELNELLEAVEAAAKLGIDGVMVQDLGVLRIIRETAPELPVFASTQMAVHNLSGALEAAAIGCRRVVLARELSKEEIGQITAKCGVETEIFVHGALCMSVSGQCYLSSMLGGRSGNRGLCAQPCRLPFSVGKSGYALSLKDLTLADRVAELAKLGVASLKIEGRMKRPEYVAAAVTALRKARDGETPDLDQLRSVFSRSGFTSGYYDAKRDRTMFGIREKEDVIAAAPVLGELAKLAARELPRVALSGSFRALSGEPITLSVCDEDGNRASAAGEPAQSAHTKPTDEIRVRQSLQKTGGTPYYFTELTVSLDGGLMIPVSELNLLRREALDQLSQKRSAPKSIPFADCLPRIAPGAPRSGAPCLRARCTAAQLSGALAAACSDLILPLGEIPKILEGGLAPGRVIAEIPRILFCDAGQSGAAESSAQAAGLAAGRCTGEEDVQEKLAALKKMGVSRAWAGNIGAIRLARAAGMTPTGGWSLNITNPYALREAAGLGLAEAELSFELSLSQARRIAPEIPVGIVGYGSLPLMAFRNCPVKAAIGCGRCGRREFLTDRKSVRFPVRCRDGVSELLNSVPLYLADRMDELVGFSYLTLWFTEEDASRCVEVAQQYAGTAPAAPPREGHTRGLYFRQVL